MTFFSSSSHPYLAKSGWAPGIVVDWYIKKQQKRHSQTEKSLILFHCFHSRDTSCRYWKFSQPPKKTSHYWQCSVISFTIHAILWRFCLSCHNHAATKLAKWFNLLLLSASCFCRLVKILQLFLQQNRLHQVQKNVPINDYLTFVTVFPILKKVQHIGLKRYFLFFFNNVLFVADS